MQETSVDFDKQVLVGGRKAQPPFGEAGCVEAARYFFRMTLQQRIARLRRLFMPQALRMYPRIPIDRPATFRVAP
jgi:hypothetical protein